MRMNNIKANMQMSYSDAKTEAIREMQANQQSDNIVIKPSHYEKYKEEPINFIMINEMEFWRGNIIKYASRAGSKLYDGMDAVESEITDLQKVQRYAAMRINMLTGKKPSDE